MHWIECIQHTPCITSSLCRTRRCRWRLPALLTGYMLANCRKSCKVCDPAKTNTGRVIDVPAKTATTR